MGIHRCAFSSTHGGQVLSARYHAAVVCLLIVLSSVVPSSESSAAVGTHRVSLAAAADDRRSNTFGGGVLPSDGRISSSNNAFATEGSLSASNLGSMPSRHQSYLLRKEQGTSRVLAALGADAAFTLRRPIGRTPNSNNTMGSPTEAEQKLDTGQNLSMRAHPSLSASHGGRAQGHQRASVPFGSEADLLEMHAKLQTSRHSASSRATIAVDGSSRGEADPAPSTCGFEGECQVVGCFPKMPDDRSELNQVSNSDRDSECSDYTPAPGPCRSGLAFYRFTSNDMSPSMCFRFCLGKGFDLSGLVDGRECRCGASRRLSALWDYGHPPVHLLFDTMLPHAVSDTDPLCKITVMNYTGALVSGAVPRNLVSLTRVDERYVAKLAKPLQNLDAVSAKADVLFRLQQEANGTNKSGGKEMGADAVVSDSDSVMNESSDVQLSGGSMLQDGDVDQREVPLVSVEVENTSSLTNCVVMTDAGDCTEFPCTCSGKNVKQTLLLSTGEECWACAPHCNASNDGCGQIPCRCNAFRNEVAISSTLPSDPSGSSSCIRCVSGGRSNAEPWPKPSKLGNRKVIVPYAFEHAGPYAVDQARIDAFKDAVADFQQAVPCIEFREILGADMVDDEEYMKGHFISVLTPKKDRYWCMAQNGGNRRRTTLAGSRRRFSARELEFRFLKRMEADGFDGPSLLWLGYCNSRRWVTHIVRELAVILGATNSLHRSDASKRWRDPWTPTSPWREAHVTIVWDNIVNESGKEHFLPKPEAYTGSFSDGILDPHGGYAEYDFFSIMHPDVQQSGKPGRNSFSTKPNGVYDQVVGSSQSLSDGDIKMFADLYHCNTDRFFINQGHRKGFVVTSLQYGDMAHIVMSEIASTQVWAVTLGSAELDTWIQKRVRENKWQLSMIRYMPSTHSFFALMDSNRWSRRRSSGSSDQRYHVGTSFSSFQRWLTNAHKESYVVTDMDSNGGFLVGVASRFERSSPSRQTVVWSANWSHCFKQIRDHATMLPAFAVTNMFEHARWIPRGNGCCAGPGRITSRLFSGKVSEKACKRKCLEYINCGAIDMNSTGHCTVFSSDFSCDMLDFKCNDFYQDGVTAFSFRKEWVVSLTTNTSITSQVIKMSYSEPEVLKFINQAYVNKTHGARLTSVVSTHWGGFAVVMSRMEADTGPPYWSFPVGQSQRFTVNQPYQGYVL